MSLFRKQALEHRRRRLFGEVVLAETRVSSVFVSTMAAFSVALLLWGLFAKYPRTERVAGVVVTSAPSAKVFAQRSGLIERLLVKNGDIVLKGQPLAYIAVELRDSNQHSAASIHLAAASKKVDLIEDRITIEERTNALDKARLHKAFDAGSLEEQSVSRQISIQQSIVSSSNSIIDRISPLAQTGFISKLEMERRQQEVLVERQRLEQLVQQRAKLRAQREEVSSALLALPERLDKALAELGGELQAAMHEKAQASIEVGYLVIAPMNGRVTSLQVAPGRNVDGRLPMLAIVPQGAQFEVDVFAPSSAIGFIREKQPVKIMFDAFPYRKFGAFNGRVAGISESAFAPTELDVQIGAEQPVYRIRVKLDRQTIPAYGQSLHLQSGMTLTANVILEERSFLDWLLEPLNAVRNRT